VVLPVVCLTAAVSVVVVVVTVPVLLRFRVSPVSRLVTVLVSRVIQAFEAVGQPSSLSSALQLDVTVLKSDAEKPERVVLASIVKVAEVPVSMPRIWRK